MFGILAISTIIIGVSIPVILYLILMSGIALSVLTPQGQSVNNMSYIIVGGLIAICLLVFFNILYIFRVK